MRRSVRELVGLRHVLTTVVVGFGLWLALGPLTGMAVARDDTGVTLPADWHVPEVRPGDGGSYRWSQAGLEPGQEFDFEWIGPKPTLNATGRLGEVLEVQLRAAGSPANPYDFDVNLFRVDETGAIVATGPERRDEDFTTCPDVDIGCTNHSKSIVRSYDHRLDAVAGIPCGLVHNLQGEPVQPGEAFVFSAPCDGDVQPLRGRLDDVSRDAAGRFQARFTLQRGALDVMSMLLRDDVPYPIEIDFDVANPGPVLSLVSFRRGTAADAWANNPLVPDPGPFTTVPRSRWGLSDEGVGHPYPLSMAIDDAARLEPRLAVYLLRHPNAYAARSEYFMAFKDPAGEHIFTWDVTLSDGIANFALTVTWSTGPILDETNVEVNTPTRERFPATAQLPAEMPTASHLLRRWGAYAGYSGATALDFTGFGSAFTTPEPPGGWGMIATCVDTACSDVEIQYHACLSYRIERWMADVEREQLRKDSLSMDCLTVFDDQGNPVESYDVYSQSGLIRGSGPPVRPTPQGRLQPIIVTPDDSIAKGVFIGAGLASVVAAALYWLWPVIRSAFGLSLFSRIQPPTVLENRIRADLLSLIEAEPGIHVRELRRRLHRAHGTIIHHLRMLVNNRLVVARTGNGRTRYFPATTNDAQSPRLLAGSDHRVALLRLVSERPRVNLSDLARALGLRRQTVHESTRRMQRDGLVDITAHGQRRHVTLTDLGRKAVGVAPATDEPA